MPRGRPRKKVAENIQPSTQREDIMKPQEIDISKPAKAKGGMAHSLDKKEDMWGGKKPPYPRSELTQKTRSGIALINK